MDFRAPFTMPGLREARDDVAGLRRDLEGAAGAMGKARGAAPPSRSAAPQTIGQQTATRSPWESLAGAGGASRARDLAAGISKGSNEAAKKGASVMDRARGLLTKDTAAAASSAASVAGKATSLVLAAAGAAGALSLAKIALGYRGVAQLQALGLRTQLQFRSLFRGVDSQPAVRAADKFLSSIFSRSSVAGRALEGLFTRGFNGLFSAIERGQPLVTAFFQGMILATLYAENAWLRVRLAVMPATTAIERAIGPTNGVKIAAAAGAITLGALALAATGAAAPFVAAGAAIGAVTAELQKLSDAWDENSFKQIKNDLGQRLGLISQEDAEKAILTRAKGNGERSAATPGAGAAPPGASPVAARGAAAPPATSAAGAASGKAYADGVARGVGAGSDAAGNAAGALAKRIDTDFRREAEIRSPSRKAERSAAEWPEGAAIGIEKNAGQVQRAAEKLVPEMPTARGSASAPSTSTRSGGPTVVQLQVQHIWPERPPTDRAAIEAAAEAGTDRALRSFASSLGVPLGLT